MLGLGEFVLDGVIEVLCQQLASMLPRMSQRKDPTGPVKVDFDLLAHVPTRSAEAAAVWACACNTATPERRRAAIRQSMVVGARVFVNECGRFDERREGDSERVDGYGEDVVDVERRSVVGWAC